MHGRGGFPVKNVIFAVFIVLLIYMTYLYNGSQNRLREAEMTGARYKREADDRITEIQDLVRAKDKAQEAWQNEKFELNNRIKSINQQHSMLQGQYKEIEADLLKLKDDMAKMSEAQQDTVNKHAQEFQVMKQEKENEISTLQNKVADLEREKSENARLIQQYKDKFIQLENERAQLENENKNLKQQISQADASKLSGQQGQQQPQQQPQQQQQVLKTTQPDLFQPHGDQQKFGHKNSAVEHMKMEGGDAVDKANPFKSFDSLDKKNDLNLLLGRGGGAEADKNKEAVEELNAQHQMIAPGHNQHLANDDEQVRNGDVKRSGELDKRPDVNPNDEQRGQILEPGLNLPDQDKAKGDEDDKKGDEKDTIVRVDEDEDEEKLEHKMPLALGQIQGPQPGAEAHKDQKEAAQQQPPILNENNDRLEDKNAGVDPFVESKLSKLRKGKESMSNVVNPVAPGEMLK